MSGQQTNWLMGEEHTLIAVHACMKREDTGCIPGFFAWYY